VLTEAELVQQWTPQIRALAQRHSGLGVEYDDLIQEGMVGLLQALRSFDPSKPMGLQSWICLIAGHEMHVAVRRARRRSHLPSMIPLGGANDSLADESGHTADEGDIWEVLYRVRDEMTVRDGPIFFSWLGANRRGPMSPQAVAARYHCHRRHVLVVIARGLRICRDLLGVDCDLTAVRIGRTTLSIAG